MNIPDLLPEPEMRAPRSNSVASQRSAPSVLWKAFDVLRAFTADSRILTFSEIASRTSMPKSTAHRVISMLVEVGALTRDIETGERYRISLSMFPLGTLSMDGRSFDLAFPHLEKLHAYTQRTVYLATLDGDHIVVLDKLIGQRSPATPVSIGGKMPARITALGKVMLAFRGNGRSVLDDAEYSMMTTTFGSMRPLADYLAEVRASGIAIDREESIRGAICIAAPFAGTGGVISAISVVARADDPDLNRLIAPIQQTAAKISQAFTAHRTR